MSQKLLDIYKSVLEYSGLHVRDDGTIYAQLAVPSGETDGTPIYEVKVGDEPFVFPIKAQFSDPNQAKVYFHPFSESFLRGESEVIQLLREYIGLRINYVTSLVVQYLLNLLASPALHKNLQENQIELLTQISDTDMETVNKWVNFSIANFKSEQQLQFVKIYLKHTGMWKGENYSRLGVVSFPFYKEICESEPGKGRFGKLRVKDRANFKKIMEFVFPGINVPENYNFGTRGRTAPYFEALMMSSGQVASRLNEVIDLYKEFIPDYEVLLFNMDWLGAFSNLDALASDIRSLPTELRGNVGTPMVKERQHPGMTVEATALPEPPKANPIPGVAVTYNKPTPSVPAAAPVITPVGASATVPSTPAQTSVAPTIRTNEKGALNFGDVLRSNPALASGTNPLAATIQQQQIEDFYRQYGYYPQPHMLQQPVMAGPAPRPEPSWARGPQPNMAPVYHQQPMPMMMGYPQQMAPQMPMQQMPPVPVQPPPPGYQWVWSPQHGQYVTVPMQPQPMQQMYPASAPNGQMPPGWAYGR